MGVVVSENLTELVSNEITQNEFDMMLSDPGLKSDNEKHEMSSEECPYTLSLMQEDFDDEKSLNKFIRSVERMIRCSPEYKIWTEYVREILGMRMCEITGELDQQTKVEIHHHPYSLFSIVKSVILKNIASKREFSSFEVATEIIQLHYELRIPFCLLVTTIHEKFHRGFISIPMELVRGDYNYFKDHYLSFLEEEEIETIMARLSVRYDNCGWTRGYVWATEPNNS